MRANLTWPLFFPVSSDNEQGVIVARMNLILDKNEAKGRSLKAADTGVEAEKALREALVTGKVGALSVDPQYLIVRAPRGKRQYLSERTVEYIADVDVPIDSRSYCFLPLLGDIQEIFSRSTFKREMK